MSLSFVSSAVLSSTDGVSHNEETEVTSKELEAVRKNAGRSKSLFEQLRSNQEEEEEKQTEQDRARMRGTLALDEDDVAHLNALNKSKAESDVKRKTEMEQEMALFRAAKEERLTGHVVFDDEEDEQKESTKQPQPQATKPVRPSIVPKIVGKRRRKPVGEAVNKKPKEAIETPKETQGALGGLLGCYGSSSDDDE